MINKDLLSKDLLSEVLFGRQKVDYIIKKDSPNLIYFQEDNLNGESCINIYELMYLMKKWALEQGYYLLSVTINPEAICDIHSVEKDTLLCEKEPVNSELRNTELEAIFKACEWVLKETR